MIPTSEDWVFYYRDRAEAQQVEIDSLRAQLAEAKATLGKINDIRNSIIGLQTINWSEHIHPLVAALEAAGIKGMQYPEAGLLDSRKTLDAASAALQASKPTKGGTDLD